MKKKINNLKIQKNNCVELLDKIENNENIEYTLSLNQSLIFDLYPGFCKLNNIKHLIIEDTPNEE